MVGEGQAGFTRRQFLKATSALFYLGATAGAGELVIASGRDGATGLVGHVGAEEPMTRTALIKRDAAYGVPHIYADDVYGLFKGYGYALAQDRLFQLEMMKRSVTGTISEVLGAGTDNYYVDFDREARSLYRPELIKSQLEALSFEERIIFEGYAEGLNTWIREVLSSPGTLMPKQFYEFDFKPEPWTAFDTVMIWVGSAAARYSDANSELSNMALLQNLQEQHGNDTGKTIFDQIRWTSDPLAPPTVPAAKDAAGDHLPDTGGIAQVQKLVPLSKQAQKEQERFEVVMKGGVGPDYAPRASNLWIAGPSKTVDDSTVFINGPQQGFTNPSYITGAGLHGAGFNVVGNTPLGWPYLVFATNGAIAWGATAGPLDVVDMYQVKLKSGDQSQYYFDGEYRSMGKRTETVKIRDRSPVSFDVYTTVHGIVTSFDLANGVAYAKKRSWEGIEVRSLLAYIDSMKATSWDEFVASSEPIGISNNRFYADKSGNIGYISVGKMPIRPNGQDFRLPAVGDGTMEWSGFKSVDYNPQVLNPEQEYLTNWNNTPSVTAGSTDTYYWAQTDRVVEFNVLFEAQEKFSVDELWEFNQVASFVDVDLRYFQPFIEEAIKCLPEASEIRQAGERIVQWSGRRVDSNKSGFYDDPAVTVFRTWLTEMIRQTLERSIPDDNWEMFRSAGDGTSNTTGTKIVHNALLGAQAGVPQTYDFFKDADKYQVVRDALSDAVSLLTTQHGPDMDLWLTAARPHIFETENFLDIPQAGTSEELRFPVAQNRGTQNHLVVFDASGNMSLHDVAPPGQSGYIAPNDTASPHYQDQLELYENFDLKARWFSEEDVEANSSEQVKLNYTVPR